MSYTKTSAEAQRACDMTNFDLLEILADRQGRARANEVLKKCIDMLKVVAKAQPQLAPGIIASVNMLGLYQEYLDPTGRVLAMPADVVAKRVLRSPTDMNPPEAPPASWSEPIVKEDKPVTVPTPPENYKIQGYVGELSERNEKILKRWNNSTLSLEQIAAEFGISRNVVNKVLWRAHNKENALTRPLTKLEPSVVKSEPPAIRSMPAGLPKCFSRRLGLSKSAGVLLRILKLEYGQSFRLLDLKAEGVENQFDLKNAVFYGMKQKLIRASVRGLYALTDKGIDVGKLLEGMSFKQEQEAGRWSAGSRASRNAGEEPPA